jgi:hypothetical protein
MIKNPFPRPLAKWNNARKTINDMSVFHFASKGLIISPDATHLSLTQLNSSSGDVITLKTQLNKTGQF